MSGTISSVDPTVRNGTVEFFPDLADPAAKFLRSNLRVDVHEIFS